MGMSRGGYRMRGARFVGAAFAAAAAFFPAIALSQSLDGVALAAACTSCHGLRGHSRGAIPSIGGLDKATLLAALRAFSADQGDPTVMNRIARGYTDAELEALADYFSQVKPQ
jgi:sulfide dehydrogenase cytochrome subunit